MGLRGLDFKYQCLTNKAMAGGYTGRPRPVSVLKYVIDSHH